MTTENYKCICNKQNMLLKYNKDRDIYNLTFSIENGSLYLHDIKNFNIYNILYSLNTDSIENINQKQITENEAEVLFIFKKIQSIVGIPKKYMAVKTTQKITDNMIIFTSTDIDTSIEKLDININKMTCDFSVLTINLLDNKINVNYDFKINSNEDLPIYMKHYVGLMMKKIFYNLKVFAEKIQK